MFAPARGPAPDTLTIAEAAALTGRHKNTIRMQVKLGQLQAEVRQGKFGEEYRIHRSALIRAGLLEGEPGAEPGRPEVEAAAPAPVPPLEREPLAAEIASPPLHPQNGLSELFQRHEQAMFRLGFLQAELEKVKALAENAESLRREHDAQREELEALRQEVETAREQLRDAEALRLELENARGRLRDGEDLRRLLTEMQLETERLRAAACASSRRRPWWRRWRRGEPERAAG